MEHEEGAVLTSTRRALGRTLVPESWHDYWKCQGQPWRTEPEIPLYRQHLLDMRRKIKPNKGAHRYPFSGLRLSRADVEWLLATHEQGKGPVDYRVKGWCAREGIDVRGADLRGVDLQRLPLSRLIGGYGDGGLPEGVCRIEENENMNGATVHLEGANLRQAELAGSCLIGVHLENANLFQAILYSADLRSACLSGTRLAEAHLEQARLCYTALSGTDLRFAHLERACLTAVHGEGVDLSAAHLVGATLIQCHWRGCRFHASHMEGADLQESTFSGVGKLFEECHLEGARLKDLTLTGCTFEGAYLAGAVVEGLRATHPDVFLGAHREEKTFDTVDLWSIRFWFPCFPSHLPAMSTTSAEEQQKAAMAPQEMLGITLTPRLASEFFAEQEVDHGKEELARGRYWDAQQHFQSALHSDPRDPYQARVLLALTHLYAGRVDQAMEELERDLLASGQPEGVSPVLYLWCHLCQCATRADFLTRVQTWFPLVSGHDPLDSLEEMGASLPSQATAELYLILLLFVRQHYRQCLEDLVELRKTWTGTYPWLLTFWEAFSRAFLEEDEQASGVLQRTIEEGIPHALLLPLRWLKENHCRPAFFDEAIRPLFLQNRLPYRDSWGQKERKKNRQAHTTRRSGGIQ